MEKVVQVPALLRELASRLHRACVERATAGVMDGALLQRFDQAKARVRDNSSLEGGNAIAVALSTLLLDQAAEVWEALNNEAQRIEEAAKPPTPAAKKRARRAVKK